MQALIALLLETGCSLVVRSATVEVTTGHKKGVRDLIAMLDNEPERLRGARVADKVIGRAAAGLLVNGGVTEVYGHVMSRKALPLLEQAGIAWSCGRLVDGIVISAGDTRCPLEQIVAGAATAPEVEATLRRHFEEMRLKKSSKQ